MQILNLVLSKNLCMKKTLFLVVLIGATFKLSAQSITIPKLYNALGSNDSFSKKLADSIIKKYSYTPKQQFVSPDSGTRKAALPKYNYAYNPMPIVVTTGHSKMPVVKMQGNSRMPVMNTDTRSPVTEFRSLPKP